jgi:hypothetical protein
MRALASKPDQLQSFSQIAHPPAALAEDFPYRRMSCWVTWMIVDFVAFHLPFTPTIHFL